MARVQYEWARRVLAEHASAAATSELLTWLLYENVDDDLVAQCHRIVEDEVRHAQLSLEVLAASGGDRDAIAPLRAAQPIELAKGEPPIMRALAVTAALFCCGETVAVPLFKAMHDGAEHPHAKSVLAQILKDEGRHRAFGWALVEHLLARTGDAGRRFVQARASTYVDLVRDAYRGPEIGVQPFESAWGMMDASAYAQAVQKAIDDEIRPRFQALGIDIDLRPAPTSAPTRTTTTTTTTKRARAARTKKPTKRTRAKSKAHRR